MQTLNGKVVIITGGAGGLGRALARDFAAAGSTLALLDKNASSLAEAATQFGQPYHAVVDMSQPAEIQTAIDAIANKFGRIDILINNAAVCHSKSMWELTEADWDDVLSVNVKGLFFALQAAARQMPSGGAILNIASVAGRVGRPTLLHYAASKSAVISITRSAAVELASRGIRVNAIAPGMMDTGMLHQLQQTWKAREGEISPSAQPSSASTLFGRPANPSEIAATALFLVSDAASYITGQTLNACGGIVMS
ncbi:SDR family NAD(P)-dependent oxidoreductase [Bryobacter aggregatus]|uniref:SDR family NAD(P)-dependent oxidoreductase n=1 Tax=Bryobacter aggregatus TaxID=360054 RepID=UPI0004E16811|nr:SDR family oxidoreductase [Bryobacter aggregatus]